MSFSRTKALDYFVVGYGNTQRRDDGIGPYIVNQLQPIFKDRKSVHLLVRHQLEPDIIDMLKRADILLFVDASVDVLAGGSHWVEVQPQLNAMPFLIHQVAPAFILGLLQGLYNRVPKTWLVSIEGNDFGFGNGLSPDAQKRAMQVIGEITSFILTEAAKKDSIASIERHRSVGASIQS